MRSGEAALRWIFELLELGDNDQQPVTHFDIANSETERWRPLVVKNNLYESYRFFCAQQKERHIATKSEFFKFLRRILPELTDSRSVTQGSRIRKIVFPSLGECRSQFENYMNMKGKIKWDAED